MLAGSDGQWHCVLELSGALVTHITLPPGSDMPLAGEGGGVHCRGAKVLGVAASAMTPRFSHPGEYFKYPEAMLDVVGVNVQSKSASYSSTSASSPCRVQKSRPRLICVSSISMTLIVDAGESRAELSGVG